MSSPNPSSSSQSPLHTLLHTCISQNQLQELEYVLQNGIGSGNRKIPSQRARLVLKVTGGTPPSQQSSVVTTADDFDGATPPAAVASSQTITISPNDQPSSLLYIEDPQSPFPQPLLSSADHPKILSETALHFASFYGNTEAFSMLLAYGAKLGVLNRHGETPTHLAAIFGRTAIISHLISKRKWKSLQRATANGRQNVLHLGALCGRGAVVKMLSEEIVRQCTVASGDSVPLSLLLTQSDNNGETPFHICVRRGDIDSVQYLLSALLAVHERTGKSAHIGGTSGTDEDGSVESSMDAPLSGLLDVDQRTLLHIATMHDKLSVAKLLLQVDPSLLNMQDSRGWTALHMATMLNLDKTEKFLKSMGASPEIANLRGLTSRQFASLPTLEEEHKKFMQEIGGDLEQFELEISGR